MPIQTERPAAEPSIANLPTPSLLIDEPRLEHNLERLRRRLDRFAVSFRPHLKTVKSPELAQRMTTGGRCAVSTLREAEVFAKAGFDDLLYTVGVAPRKLGRVRELRRDGVNLSVVLDSQEQAEAVARAAVPAFVEVDVDGHRGGVAPDGGELLRIAERLSSVGCFRGVMAHAGESYRCRSEVDLRRVAEQERRATVDAAERIRSAGFETREVSIGATPTCLASENLDGVTEVRAGVYPFMDLTMCETGVCSVDDVALSVLASVIGRSSDGCRLLIDAGWAALSRDLGFSAEGGTPHYGVACDLSCNPYEALVVLDVTQEHGVLGRTDQRPAPSLPIGDLVRILPNHACATAAQHDGYGLVRGAKLIGSLSRIRGW